MKLQNIIASAFLIVPLSSCSPLQATNDLHKRQAWSVYLYSNFNCGASGTQGGYSDFGSHGCTAINSESVDGDPEGCSIQIFTDSGCRNLVHTFTGAESCFGAGTGPSIQSFRVNC